MMKHAYASLHCTGNARQRVSTSNRACSYLETLPRAVTQNRGPSQFRTHRTTLSNNVSSLQSLDDVRGSDNFQRALDFIDVINAQFPMVDTDSRVDGDDAAQLIGLTENYNGIDDGFGDDVVREIKGRGVDVVAYLNDKLKEDGLAMDAELPDGASDDSDLSKINCSITQMAVAVGYALNSCSNKAELFGLGPVCHSLRLAQVLRCGLVNGYNITQCQNFILQNLDAIADDAFNAWWNTVSRSHQRNLIMALAHSVTNDDLHCQSLLGADTCQGVRLLEVPCQILFDSRYAHDLPTDGGAASHVVVSEDGVVSVDTLNQQVKFSHFEGSHPDQSLDNDELGERVTCLYHVPASNEVLVPVLARGDRMVVDLRPGQVITHAYKTTRRMRRRDENLCCPMTTGDLYEPLNLQSIFRQNVGNQVTEWDTIDDVTFAYKKTANDADGHPRILGSLYDDWSVGGINIVDEPYMTAHDDARTYADSHRGSAYQIESRYGSIRNESVLGYNLPIAVEAIQFPTISETPIANFHAGIGFAEPRPCKTVTVQSDNSLRVVDSPPAAAAVVVAPLSIRPPHAGPKSQLLINAPAVTPSHGELATQLSRPGRRNIVGIALQKMEPGQPGDIMLYDS